MQFGFALENAMLRMPAVKTIEIDDTVTTRMQKIDSFIEREHLKY